MTSSTGARGFICSQDGTFNYPLSPKLTTIGRENCDIVLNNPIDSQHAVIEYSEEDNCYLIHDLNTVNGTYVNEVRIQNSAARITEHDVIRFGFNGIPFQLVIQPQISTIPPIHLNGLHRQSIPQQLQVINQTLPCRGSSFLGQPFQQNNGWSNQLPNATLINANIQQRQQQNNNGSQFKMDASASLRSRPTSAGGFQNIRSIKTITKSNSCNKGFVQNQNSFFQTPNVDSETYRQDDQDSITRIALLERELKSKAVEIKDLKDKVSFYQGQISLSGQNNEIEQIKRDKSIAVGLVNTMQKDLSNKDATISKLAREVENIKKELKEKDDACKTYEEQLRNSREAKKVEEERQNKENELIVLKTKFRMTENKIVDLTNQILQVKSELEESRKVSSKYAQTEAKLKEELEQAKAQFVDMQRVERVVRVDLEQVKRTYEKFRSTIIQSIFSVPGSKSPNSEITDEEITSSWKKVVQERAQNLKSLDEMSKSLKINERVYSLTFESIQNLESKLSSIEQRLSVTGRRSVNLENDLKELKSVVVHENLTKLKEQLINLYENQLRWSEEIDVKLGDLGIECDQNESITIILQRLFVKMNSLKEEKLILESKLDESKTKVSEQLGQELEKKTSEFEQTIKTLEKKHLKELEDNKKTNESLINLIKNDFNLKINQLNEEISTHLNQIETHKSVIVSLKTNIESTTVDSSNLMNEFNEKLTNTETEMKTLQEKHQVELYDLETKYQLKYEEQNDLFEQQKTELLMQMNETSNNYHSELSMHKEQIKQHSLTIVSFEKELTSLRERELTHLKKIESLEKSLREFSGVRMSVQKVPSPPPHQSVHTKVSEGVEISFNKTIDLLRAECSTYKQRLSEQDELIKTLRRDLAGASAKLSDTHGQLSEKQKRELERNKQLISDQTKELSDTRCQLAKLSEIVDKQTKQLEISRVELSKSKALVEKYRMASEENGKLAIELKLKLEDVESQLKGFENVKKEEGKITSELTAIGAQCKGERHEQVISRQREALAELRQRCKQLEQSRPLVPAHQQQMQQQIMLLKKQLAEVRASQAMSEDIAKHASLARGNDDAFLMIEEKTAHFETQTALESSEESFLTMLRSIASLLDINELDGFRSMCNLPPDERQKLNLERTKSIENICFKIKGLLEKIQRKDELLKDYEIDLAKLRQSEFLLEKKTEQLDDNHLYLRNKEDEIEYLKESLKNAKSELEKEKLINLAIKQKKNLNSIQISTERARRGSTDKLHHHCPPEDPRANLVKKTLNEQMKRKDYEMKALKQEIKDKNDELSNLTSRLTLIESTRTINNPNLLSESHK